MEIFSVKEINCCSVEELMTRRGRKRGAKRMGLNVSVLS